MTSNGRGARCHYCDRVLEATTSLSKVAATRDHVVPKSIGGERRVWCCRQCNSLKGDMLPEAWAKFMADNPRWWTMPQFQRGTLVRKPMNIPPDIGVTLSME